MTDGFKEEVGKGASGTAGKDDQSCTVVHSRWAIAPPFDEESFTYAGSNCRNPDSSRSCVFSYLHLG